MFDEADTLIWDPDDDLVVINLNVDEDEDVTQVMFYLEFLYENIFLELSFEMFSGVSCTTCIKNKYQLLSLVKVKVS